MEVIECREQSAYFLPFRLLRLALKFLKVTRKFDVMIVGFPGQEVMPLARFLTRKPIIFDAFTSHYGGYVLDRQKFSPRSWRARYFWWVDRWSCRLADIILLDTQAHIIFFVDEFRLPREKFRWIWIGADEDAFYPRETAKDENIFSVIFFGTYVPLQGAEFIVKAAKILEKEKIIFNFIGKGQDEKKAKDLAERLKLKNIVFKDMMKREELVNQIAAADISLGLFGLTPKTLLVIPNKVYESLAMKKAVVTADTPAIRELFTAGEILMVKAGDPESLARGILRLKNDGQLRQKLAHGGYCKYKEQATSLVLGGQLKNIIKSLL